MFTIEDVRSIWRTLDRSDLTGIAAVCLAVGIIGVSYGASTVTAGLPAWLPILLSVLVLAGGAEFLFVGIVSAGGSLVAAVLVGLVVNARHLPYGLALPEVVGTGWRRLLGTHVMNDEAVALALAEPDRNRRHARYWLCGFGVLLAWPLGAALGVAIGATVPDPSRFGLDAVFPAVLLALAVPALRDKATRRAVVVGATIAAVTTPFLAAGIPVLLALPAALLAYNREQPESANTADPIVDGEHPDRQATDQAGPKREDSSNAAGKTLAEQEHWRALGLLEQATDQAGPKHEDSPNPSGETPAQQENRRALGLLEAAAGQAGPKHESSSNPGGETPAEQEDWRASSLSELADPDRRLERERHGLSAPRRVVPVNRRAASASAPNRTGVEGVEAAERVLARFGSRGRSGGE